MNTSFSRKCVDVVALIIPVKNGIIVEKRRSDKAIDPNTVVIPGGHVELGESLEETCRRELKEELDLDCSKFVYVITRLHETPVEAQVVHYYVCLGWCGQPKSIEAESIFSVSRNDLDVLDFEIDRQAARIYFEEYFLNI